MVVLGSGRVDTGSGPPQGCRHAVKMPTAARYRVVGMPQKPGSAAKAISNRQIVLVALAVVIAGLALGVPFGLAPARTDDPAATQSPAIETTTATSIWRKTRPAQRNQ